MIRKRTYIVGTVLLAVAMAFTGCEASEEHQLYEPHFANPGENPPAATEAPRTQDLSVAETTSAGCLSCHETTDQPTMHANPAVVLGCTDCHGGNAVANRPEGSNPGDPSYLAAVDEAHVKPRFPETWHYPSSANPKDSYGLLNREDPAFIRFINPSDYRVVREACGECHLPIIQAAERSLMSTSAMFWGGAAYNNGILPFKNYIVGEAYTRDGVGATLVSPAPPDEQMARRGILPSLVPMPAWEVIPPADIFRVFERGGRNILTQFPEIGLPNLTGNIQRLEEPGRPDLRQSNRGPGTGLRIAVPVLNIHKTRLNDPQMWFLGTNEQPGDYRSSGCAGCHVVYANDRDQRHSGPYAKFGHDGETQTADPTIPKNESGHPLKHEFTNAIPTSQCMVCHMHQPNSFLNSYLGYTMWDYESDAPVMWPGKQKYPSDAETREINKRNPEGAAVRGKWGDIDFLKKVSELNPQLKNTQFADYHGHGWNFRAVFRKDRNGDLLDSEGGIVSPDDPEKFKKAVHMSSIHLDAGMNCVDCHFAQDSHGNGWIYGEVANAIEIRCKDCHGTADSYPSLRTSGPAARPEGWDLSLLRTPDGRRRFDWRGSQCDRPITEPRDCKLYQRPSLWPPGTTPPVELAKALGPNHEWEMSLVKDTVDPAHSSYNSKAARAKLMSKSTKLEWGPGVAVEDRAHQEEKMECFSCHLSWTPSCGGCHLPIEANWKSERQHYEGGETRNYATYNPQVLRDQMFQLGIHGSAKGNTIAPVRSTSALVLSSTNINREKIYIQQPPIAASGYSSQAFTPHFPHTVRKDETKQCTDCHLSKENDNNAIMAQLLLLGTNFVNFVGFNAWVGGDGGIEAVQVTEWEEPQAVIGSFLHKYAYPDWFAKHQKNGQKLTERYTQPGYRSDCIQLRGEYLFVAEGTGGMRVYDVASIANKGVSDRIISAPFSPLGHDTHIPSSNATCVVLPTNQPIHPDRQDKDSATRILMLGDNQEQPFHPIYDYAIITDAEEGLILTDINTLADGEPRNNFLDRALTWNENGILDGARHATIGGYYVYVVADAGLVALNLDAPLRPKVEAVIPFADARASALQFRYLFVTDKSGFHVVNVTDPGKPERVEGAFVPLSDAQRVYVARTYAYVAAKREGLVIIDIERPTQPKVSVKYTASGQITDARDVIVGTTNASLFAYVADGTGGLKVVQLTSPESQPRFYGFSPRPNPELIAWRPTRWPALSLSKGIDRDRGVDETGGQIAVFGRLGSRPFTLEEMQKLYLGKKGEPWFVSDDVVR